MLIKTKVTVHYFKPTSKKYYLHTYPAADKVSKVNSDIVCKVNSDIVSKVNSDIVSKVNSDIVSKVNSDIVSKVNSYSPTDHILCLTADHFRK